MVVVSGGKGGVGTSTVSLQLAKAISQLGQRAILVEADLDRGGAVQQADDGPSIVDCIAGRVAVRDALEPKSDGMWILPGAWAPRDLSECTATAQDRLIVDLRSLDTHADLLFVDVGSSRNSFVRRFWRAASMVVMVTTPDAASVQDSYAAIKVLLAGDTSIPVYTLVNFAGDPSSAALVHERLRATCKRFLGLRISPLGEAPPVTMTGTLYGDLHGDSPSARSAFHPLVEKLCNELGVGKARHRTLRMAA